MKCPECGKDIKTPVKEWDLSPKVHVKMYEHCGKKFREYTKKQKINSSPFFYVVAATAYWHFPLTAIMRTNELGATLHRLPLKKKYMEGLISLL